MDERIRVRLGGEVTFDLNQPVLETGESDPDLIKQLLSDRREPTINMMSGGSLKERRLLCHREGVSLPNQRNSLCW